MCFDALTFYKKGTFCFLAAWLAIGEECQLNHSFYKGNEVVTLVEGAQVE